MMTIMIRKINFLLIIGLSRKALNFSW